MQGIDYGLQAGSNVKAVLNSAPIELGNFQTDSSGNLNVQIHAPANIPTGFHTLHLYTTNIAGEPMDIQDVIYIAASPDDF